MALIRGGNPIGELRGSIGAYTFSRNRAGMIMKARAFNSFASGDMVAIKTTDTSVVSDNTNYNNDSELTLAVVASTNYVVQGMLLYNNQDAVTTRSVVNLLNLPAGAVLGGIMEFTFGTANQFPRVINSNAWNGGGVTTNVINANGTGTVWFEAGLIVGATAGNVQVSWKPSANTANAMVLKACSWLGLQKQS